MYLHSYLELTSFLNEHICIYLRVDFPYYAPTYITVVCMYNSMHMHINTLYIYIYMYVSFVPVL